MCDFSLEVYGSRPAREGEKYVTSRFPSGAVGLAVFCLQLETEDRILAAVNSYRLRPTIEQLIQKTCQGVTEPFEIGGQLDVGRGVDKLDHGFAGFHQLDAFRQ